MLEACPRLEVVPETPTARCRLAGALLRRGRLEAMHEELNAALRANPEYANAHHVRGLAFLQCGQPRTAVEPLAWAARLAPHRSEFWFALAAGRRQAGQLQEALQAATRAVRLDARDARNHLLRGRILADLDRPEAASGAFERALRCQPELAAAHRELGKACAGRDELDQALDHLLAAVRLEPSDPQSRLALGDVLRRRGDLRQAVEAYRAAAGLIPSDAEVYTRLGATLLELERPLEAMHALWAALGRDPHRSDCCVMLSQVYRTLGRGPEAEALLRKAREVESTAKTAAPARTPQPRRPEAGTDHELRVGRLLRRDLRITDLGTDGALLGDPVSGLRFRVDEATRQLVSWLDEGCDVEAACARYQQHFARSLPRRQARALLRQIHDAGLAQSSSKGVASQATTAAATASPVPVPLSATDPGRGLNTCFDLLTVLLGWLFHPAILVPLLGLVLVAITGLVRESDRAVAEFTQAFRQEPLGNLLVLVLVRMVFLTLPREALVGVAARRVGGRVRRFHLQLARGLIPTFYCDVGESALLCSGWPRWALLSIRFWLHLMIAAVATLGWLVAGSDSLLGHFWLLLLIPSWIGALLRLNIFMQSDAQAVLSAVWNVPRLQSRALAATGAWLTLRPPPEPLTKREQFRFRVFGVGILLWRLGAYGLMVGVLGWVLINRFAAVGALVGAGLLFRWHQDMIGKTLMEGNTFRWLVRGGGHWWIRWPIRLAVLAGLVAAAFIPYGREASGQCRIVPAAQRGVRAEITGTINLIHVSEGDLVEAGMPLVSLIARTERANVEMTEAALAGAQADLALLQAGSRPEVIAMTAEEVELRRIQFENAETELRRVRRLFENKTASEDELTEAQDERDGAERVLRIAQEKLETVQAGAREEEIDAAKAEVARLEAQLAHHRELLELHVIRAPIAGRVVTPHIQERAGQYVEPGDLIAVVEDTSRLRAEVLVPETSAGQIAPGMPVKVRLWGLDGQLMTGRVTAVASVAADYATLAVAPVRSDREARLEESLESAEDRYVGVLVELDSIPDGVLSQMTGTARIVLGDDRLGWAIARPIVRFFRVEVWSWLP